MRLSLLALSAVLVLHCGLLSANPSPCSEASISPGPGLQDVTINYIHRGDSKGFMPLPETIKKDGEDIAVEWKLLDQESGCWKPDWTDAFEEYCSYSDTYQWVDQCVTLGVHVYELETCWYSSQLTANVQSTSIGCPSEVSDSGASEASDSGSTVDEGEVWQAGPDTNAITGGEDTQPIDIADSQVSDGCAMNRALGRSMTGCLFLWLVFMVWIRFTARTRA